MPNAIYVFSIRKKEDFTLCSRFLNKYTQKEVITKEELQNVRYTTGSDNLNNFDDVRKMLKHIVQDSSNFTYVSTHREEITEFRANYQFVAVMDIDASLMKEIVLYQNVLLIQNYFRNIPIYCLIHSEERFYYTISQYLNYVVQGLKLENRIFVSLSEKKNPDQKKNSKTSESEP